MHLKRISIENFRGITDLDIELDRTTVLIGENNTGKSSVLEAVNLCLSRGLGRRAVPFSDYDFHLTAADADPTQAPPLKITLDFEETAEKEWADEVVQTLSDVIQVLEDGRQCVVLQVTSFYDAAIRDFTVEWTFLDVGRNPLPARQQRLLADLQRLAPVFLLNAVRDASQQFRPGSAFWGPFTRNPEIDEEKRKEIEEQVGQVNQSVLDSHKPFEAVKEHLTKTGDLVPLLAGDLVSIEAFPARILDILRSTQIKLASKTGAKLPIGQHGSGTQSLSVLFLFEAFLHSRLAEAYDQHSEPILALEEPEAHLHPSAIRALWPTLDALPGQRIIASHSGDLLAVVPLEAVRRLARKAGKVQVFSIRPGTLDADEELKVAYHIREKRGGLLFARCWLLVEGESDYTLLPNLARAAGNNFEHEGIVCVEYAQCPLGALIKTARDLGISWHLLADGDAQGTIKAGAAKVFLDGDLEADHITQLTERDIEHCLWNAGYDAVYENAVDGSHQGMVASAKGTNDYISETIDAACKSTSKPHLAYAVAMEARARGATGVPAQLNQAIEAVLKLARAET